MKTAKAYKLKIISSGDLKEFEDLLNSKKYDILFDTFRITEDKFYMMVGEYIDEENVK